jgi:hypothetical protein
VIPSPRVSAAGPGASRGGNLISYAILSSLLISYTNFSPEKSIFPPEKYIFPGEKLIYPIFSPKK